MEKFRFFLGGKNPLSLSYLIQSQFCMACYWLFAGQSWPVDSLVQDWFLNKLLFPKVFWFSIPWVLSIYLTGRGTSERRGWIPRDLGQPGAGCGCRPISLGESSASYLTGSCAGADPWPGTAGVLATWTHGGGDSQPHKMGSTGCNLQSCTLKIPFWRLISPSIKQVYSVNFWISQFSLKNVEGLLGATRSCRRKFLQKFSKMKWRFCKKLGVLRLREKCTPSA